MHTRAGEYRLVGEISINGVRGKYASENTFTVTLRLRMNPIRREHIPIRARLSGFPTLSGRLRFVPQRRGV